MTVNFAAVADGAVTWEFGDGAVTQASLYPTRTSATQPWSDVRDHGAGCQ